MLLNRKRRGRRGSDGIARIGRQVVSCEDTVPLRELGSLRARGLPVRMCRGKSARSRLQRTLSGRNTWRLTDTAMDLVVYEERVILEARGAKLLVAKMVVLDNARRDTQALAQGAPGLVGGQS